MTSVVLITGGPGSFRIQFVESAFGSQPEVARTILKDGSNRIVAEAGGIIGVMPVVDKLFCFRIEPIEAVRRADPEDTLIEKVRNRS
jgi:hypothetical protein